METTEEDKKRMAGIVGAMAWADGELHPLELSQAKEQLACLGLSDKEAEEMVENSRYFAWESELEKFPMDLQLQALKRCYLVARAHYGMAMTEEAMLRKMAARALPDKPWLKVKKWLEHFYDWETESRDILGYSFFFRANRE